MITTVKLIELLYKKDELTRQIQAGNAVGGLPTPKTLESDIREAYTGLTKNGHILLEYKEDSIRFIKRYEVTGIPSIEDALGSFTSKYGKDPQHIVFNRTLSTKLKVEASTSPGGSFKHAEDVAIRKLLGMSVVEIPTYDMPTVEIN